MIPAESSVLYVPRTMVELSSMLCSHIYRYAVDHSAHEQKKKKKHPGVLYLNDGNFPIDW
jgi:hypothetical protein